MSDQIKTYDESDSHAIALAGANQLLADYTASQRVAWALQRLPGSFVLTSSFGAQAAAMLQLVSNQQPDIPVILIDTGYLFTETYRFVDELTGRLKLNLRVYRSELSAAWQEARYGKRWEKGLQGIEAFNRENKVEPMEQALLDLNAKTWFAGLRRNQSESRRSLQFLEGEGRRWKVHPLADWTDRDIHEYLSEYDLPYHPLWFKGYVSIGDVHTTRALHEVTSLEETRFFGLKRECGIHDIDFDRLDAASQ
ncbi:MAG: phosphoadenylyl-sulfate reductase [Gammaproteobacteria bacterium]|nr:phosphoadenylyl-sulfate reductase [Gammaproteobacteria bacterium]